MAKMHDHYNLKKSREKEILKNIDHEVKNSVKLFFAYVHKKEFLFQIMVK